MHLFQQKLNPIVRKYVMEENPYDWSASDDIPIDIHRCFALSRTAQTLLRNNVSSSTSNRSRMMVQKDREEAIQLLIRNYFANNAMFGEEKFCRRFRMRKHMSMYIVSDLEMNYHYLQTLWDTMYQRCFNVLQNAHEQYIN